MKTTMTAQAIVGGALMLGMVSCGATHYKIATRLNADGSCLREVYARGDSAFLAGNWSRSPYTFQLDSSWQVTPLDSGSRERNDERYNVKISKTFRAIDEISAGLQCEDVVRPLFTPTETLQKRFRWFYTCYTFKAVYPCIADKIPVAIDSFLSREEQALWLRGDFSACRGMNGMELNDELDEIEKKFLTWRARIFYETYFEVICSFESSVGSSPYLPRLAAAKDSLFLMLVKKNIDSVEEIGAIYRTLDVHFSTRYFSATYSKNKAQIDKLCEAKLENLVFLEEGLFGKDIEYVLTMTGKVVDANAPLVAQDTLTWRVSAVRLLADDYELTATSRKANAWAFAVVILLIALSAYCSARVRHFTKVKR
ncbi:MAG: hypothetical protein LBT94_01680 [Prevotellaceae bacterium]|jgi:hypothetical protein|nr:hypothetical protein [Prevotellaceae bacterium]